MNTLTTAALEQLFNSTRPLAALNLCSTPFYDYFSAKRGSEYFVRGHETAAKQMAEYWSPLHLQRSLVIDDELSKVDLTFATRSWGGILAKHFLASSKLKSLHGDSTVDWSRLLYRPESLAGQPVESQSSLLDWVSSSDKILERLESNQTPRDEQLTAVLFAETTAFSDAERPRLLNVLQGFIEQNRFSSVDETITALCSAIRKYAMNMDESRFDSYATWLLPSQTAALSYDLELEFSKAVAWRLMYEPFAMTVEYPELLRGLYNLGTDYLKARLILQNNHASTVLHCIVGVAILDAAANNQGTLFRSLLEKVQKVQVDWFSELISDRLNEAIESLAGHNRELASRLRTSVLAGI